MHARPPTLPNFLVIGAGKAGTTSLHRWLGQHPDVFVTPLKETNYFTFEATRSVDERTAAAVEGIRYPVRSWEAYLELYQHANAFSARGEASPSYLGLAAVAETIASRLADVRLIALLRNPVDRAYSSFLMHVREGREGRSMRTATEEELSGTANPSLAYGQRRYLGLGLYHGHLADYRSRFDSSQLHIELFDDLRIDPEAVLRRIHRFLGVDDGFTPDMSIRMNPSGIPRRKLFAPLLKKNPVGRLVKAALPGPLRDRAEQAYDRWRARQLVKPDLDPGLRAELVEHFREDIRRLEESIGRDLSSWLE